MTFRKVNIETAVQTTNTILDDTLIVLGKSSFSGDIGFLGKRAASTYAGLIRDNTTGKFVLIDSYNANLNSNDIDVENALVQRGDLELKEMTADDVTVHSNFIIPLGAGASRPSNPVEGQIWFNTDTKLFEGYDGTSWIVFLPATVTPNT